MLTTANPTSRQSKQAFALTILLAFLAFSIFASQVSAQPTIKLSISKNSGYNLGSDINGQFTVSTKVSSDVTRVEFYLNGTLEYTGTAQPFSWTFNTNNYALGYYNITAVAYNSAGQQATASMNQNFVSNFWSIWLPIVILVPTIAVIVIIIVVARLRNRGKLLKCPDCGHVFNAPAMDERSFGFGATLPGMGKVKCPNCGVKRSRRDYEKVAQQSET